MIVKMKKRTENLSQISTTIIKACEPTILYHIYCNLWSDCCAFWL